MNDSDELEAEKRKSRQLEERLKASEEALEKSEAQLGEWHRRAMDKLSSEDALVLLHSEQLSSLTYHLLKYQNLVSELEVELAIARKELDVDRKILSPSNGAKDKPEKKASVDESNSGQRIGATEILSDDELSQFLGMEEVHKELQKKPSKRIRDLIDLIIRLQRVKVVDASILLDVDKGLMNVWVEKLKSKNLIQVDGASDPVLLSTGSLVKLRKMMK